MQDENTKEIQTDVEAAILAGLQLGQARHGEAPAPNQTAPYLVVPKNAEVRSLEVLLPAPVYTRQRVTLEEAGSFVRYVKEFAGEGTRIFCHQRGNAAEFNAVIDYHRPGAPAWGAHVAILRVEPSDQWTTWLARNKQSFAQEEFAQFIEENLSDVSTPTGAELLEVVMTLQAHTDVEFETAVRLDNGNVALRYAENTTARAGQKGQLTIPSKFSLGIPVFKHGARYALLARLRYRIRERKLTLWYELDNWELVQEHAFNELREIVQTETEIQPFLGSVV